MTESQLHEHLRVLLEQPLKLVVTDNRRSMITCTINPDGVLALRAHKMFLHAPARVLRSLASFCKHPTKSNRRVINRYIEDNDHLIRSSEEKKLAPEKRKTKGRHHDLDEIFIKLNRKYFSGKCTAAYTWGRLPGKRRHRRSINLGNYNYKTNTIRMHPVLDNPFVPDYVVELVLYHEMLHWYIPPKRLNGRNYVHTRLFNQAETAHPAYEKAENWKTKNLSRLLAG